MERPRLGNDLDRRLTASQWESGGGIRKETTSGWTGRCFRLGQNKEVFDAEAYAIYQALCIPDQRQEDGHHYIIFVDSEAAIDRIGADATGPGQRFAGGVGGGSNRPATIYFQSAEHGPLPGPATTRQWRER